MIPTLILGAFLAVSAFVAGAVTDMSAVLARSEARSRFMSFLAALALGLLIANSGWCTSAAEFGSTVNGN